MIQACQRWNVDYTIIHTGQQYSDSLDSVFFDQLELPKPDYNLGVGSSSHTSLGVGNSLSLVERNSMTQKKP